MLYKKNQSEKLDIELFKNPTSEYRGAPFWAWNCELDETELLRQIECLKAMGLGGFHMHTRSGMATKYLSEEFMQLIKACVEKAKQENMHAWLYDEDRWPSGTAGGYVTKTPEFRSRRLLFTPEPIQKVDDKETALKRGTTYFLGSYDVVLNQKGELQSYRLLKEGEEAEGAAWFAYVGINPPPYPGWYNGEPYIDTLNPAAVKRFIELTHEAYKKAVGDDFGEAVPAIFTDEPQFVIKQNLSFAESRETITLTWTPDFDETYRAAYGFDIKEKLPELFWELPEGAVSTARYYYHDHVCERFISAFCDTCGAWCRENGIYLTGHMVEESTLQRQTSAIGEAMRAYRSFGLPGVDMLCDSKEFATVKQAQSAVRQYGREGLTSELYGVTDWDFDFRGHKNQGDWQAAMGVTQRVHHLAWVSMKGSAKRDFPASINYQSPWYREYSYIEDHFARLNTVLTRGKPCVRVGVIHPIESYWLHWGPAENTSVVREQKDENFANIIQWLLFGTIDFDLISEACLPELCGEIGEKLAVGAMAYSTILVPDCETLRGTTVEILNRFMDRGGRVIVAGEAPKYIDAVPNEAVTDFYERTIHIPFNRQSVLEALEEERDLTIKDDKGQAANEFIYQMRKDGRDYSLFITRVSLPGVLSETNRADMSVIKTVITIRGDFKPVLMNTLTGACELIDFELKNGCTVISYDFFKQDSLLLRLEPPTCRVFKQESAEKKTIGSVDFKTRVTYRREEDNVCILDLAGYALDDGAMQETEEVLRIDKKLREHFDWPLADGCDVQPWAIEQETISHFVTLRFTFESEQALPGTYFCAEELVSLEVNGAEVFLQDAGYFIDKSIRRYALPQLQTGENIICAKVPIGKRTSLEACYLTGNFDVKAEGCVKTLTAPSESIGFGDITAQGMPFYGGNVIYSATVNVPEDCDLVVNIAKYSGALTKVFVDGEDKGAVVFAPYDLSIQDVSAGEHKIEFKLFGNRYNTFGALHNCGNSVWVGPENWYAEDDDWCYEYDIRKTGILKSPVITMMKKKKI